MRFSNFKPLQAVNFYTANGWKKGIIREISTNSITVTWKQNADTRITRVYDVRNIKPSADKATD